MTKPRLFRGVIVPTVTPLHDLGAIDVSAIARITEYLLEHGVHGIFPLGTTGEGMSVGVEARLNVVRATIDSVGGRAAIYAGVSSNVMSESIEAAKRYADLGADAVVAHVPTYYALSEQEVETYFLTLADACPLPLVLYNIPVTTHHTMSIELIVRLSKHPNIAAIKDSATDSKRAVQLVQALGAFPVLLGSRFCFADGLRAGAAGTVPAGAHLMPAEYCAMYEASLRGDWTEVERLQSVTNAGMSAVLGTLGVGQSIAVIKAELSTRGLCSAAVLPPLQSADARRLIGGAHAK